MNLLKPSALAAVIKVFLLAVATALLVWMIYTAVLASDWVVAGTLALVLIGANYVYFSKRAVASKFLFPGTVLLVIFVIVPIVYTAWMSVYNYKTGNEITKDQAITQLKQVGLVPDPSGTTYDMVLGKANGKDAVLLTNQATHEVSLGDAASYKILTPGSYTTDKNQKAISATGFVADSPSEIAAASSWLSTFSVPVSADRYVTPQGADVAALMHEKFQFNKDNTQIQDSVTGVLYVDNGNGNFVSKKDAANILYPGWRQFNPAQNYLGLFTDPKLSGPFIGVFVWTIAFAFITVLMMWAVGLTLAIAMDKKIRFRNFYRAILILPYAMPAFMSILIWGGIFNGDYGALNNLLGTHVQWLNDPWLARGVILTVNLWLGFPYFYLISTGALQALPTDIEEAAEIDGASGSQIFWRIKLPLLFQILSPLLIASFAFNFNNFNIVYLLTKGGPTDVLNGQTAGATDILITYAYKTAFGSNEQNLGLACAISVVMFVIVGALSMWSLKRSRVLEEM
jgi:arabinogalactan oligomer/maltooligosaccharide transport system permease protein